jgi:L-alanine-DL-glutamate epimerase-like enolase superfamily enzyme
MNRKRFIKLAGTCLTGAAIFPDIWAAKTEKSTHSNELGKHVIDECEVLSLEFRWPRFVGKNGRIGFHGQERKTTALRLKTNQGAVAWGLSKPEANEIMPELVKKKVSDLILPGEGIAKGLDNRVDFALHDLMGVILDQPVYKLIGNKGAREVPLYSGMIYFDELNPGNESKGVDAILENCAWDMDYGYRQLKVKIGRSGRWYEHKRGLAKDIEIVREIHAAYKDKGVQILVDANDMYSLQDTFDFLRGIGDVPLFWIEEPFTEEMDKARSLKHWMMQNGYAETYYADGEFRPDMETCLDLGGREVLDVFLPDTYSYGFSNWLRLMPKLKKINMLASPHAWGDRLKSHYTVHLAAGLGNICTVEGVTCISDDIDYGDYPLVDGIVRVSDEPGFGMKLLK